MTLEVFVRPIGQDVTEQFSIDFDLIKKAPELQTDQSQVVKSKELTLELLTDLFNEEICAIHIPGYFDRDVADRAASLILKDAEAKAKTWYVTTSKKGEFTKSDMAYGVGHPLYKDKPSKHSYFTNAVKWMNKIRSFFHPYLSPMDRLRYEISELWPHRVAVPINEKGQSYFAGMLRMMDPSFLYEGIAKTKGCVHIDDSNSPRKTRIFSANCYVSIPKNGGYLQIWNIPLNKKNRANPVMQLIIGFCFIPGAQDVIQRFLPKPLVIHPKAGDLVIFDTARPHAVAGFKKGRRINLQTFLWYSTQDKSVEIYS
jgi:2OG-Fe(II) oxygenase superfamily